MKTSKTIIKLSILLSIIIFALSISKLVFAAAPVMTTPTIYPATTANDSIDLYGYCNATDADASALTYEYTWYKNGQMYYRAPQFNNGSLGMGTRHSCAIRSNDSVVVCWGENQAAASQGAYVTGDSNLASPQLDPVISADADRNRPAKKIRAGLQGGIMIDNSSLVVCWGYNSPVAQCGTGFSTNNLAATETFNSNKVIDVDMGRLTSCVINASDYRVYCSGEGSLGELGDGLSTDTSSFVATSDTSQYIKINTGLDHTCGIMFNGSVKCWGSNTHGQQGGGSAGGSNANPTYISSSAQFIDIDSRSYHTCAIRANDSIAMCWGNNSWGQFGNGTANGGTYATLPVVAFQATPVKQIVTGHEFSCAIRASDNRVLCAGRNNVGQLATGTNTDSSTPQTITNTSAFLEIAAGGYHVCGIENNTRRVVCWGWNWGSARGGGGQVGVGTNTTNNYTSAQFVNMTIAVAGTYPASKEINVSFPISNNWTTLGDTFILGCKAYDSSSFSSEANSTSTYIGTPSAYNITSYAPYKYRLANSTSTDVTTTGQTGVQTILAGVNTTSLGNYSALLYINFTQNINVTNITMNISKILAKSFFHNSSPITGLINISILIPRTYSTNQIYVCPGATSLSQVTETCANKVIISNGSSSNGMSVTTTTYDGEIYYLVSNITGTGGGESGVPINYTKYYFENNSFVYLTSGTVVSSLSFNSTNCTWLIMAHSNVNKSSVQLSTFNFTKDSTIIAQHAETREVFGEGLEAYYTYVYVGDNTTDTFVMSWNYSSGGISNNNSAIMALCLDNGMPNPQFNYSVQSAEYNDLNSIYDDQGLNNDYITTGLNVTSPGYYLIIGTANTRSNASSAPSNIRLMQDSTAQLSPNLTFHMRDDTALVDYYLTTLTRVTYLTAGMHNFTFEARGNETNNQSDWKNRVLLAMRLTDNYKFFYTQTNGQTSTNNDTVPISFLNLTTPLDFGYFTLVSGIQSASSSVPVATNHIMYDGIGYTLGSVRVRNDLQQNSFTLIRYNITPSASIMNITYMVDNNLGYAEQEAFTILALDLNNTIPVTTFANISPSAPTAGQTVLGYCNGTDADSDSIYYNYKWYKDGAEFSNGTSAVFASGTLVNAANLSSGQSTAGTWIFSCQASDGINSNFVNSTAVVITGSISSCSWPGGGDWVVNGTDQCNLTSNTLLNSYKFICRGSGYVNVYANITNWTEVLSEQSCRMTVYSGNRISRY